MAKTTAESKMRLQELERLAEEAFASRADARSWLLRPHPLLEGASPLQVGKTEDGARRIQDMLVAIKYGGVV
ncbi:antitoxin Xre/MbcA/ParS toxin-binding domain-containing protein [Hydrogenophaga sp. UC242_50]|uniref:antitoxin Xre/MbcA/ParS toxin-binding domain-containing protein n=2 Tax=unclassified Hydrogenophaga TaxID=2610897 RepID=UPI0036D31984